MTENSAYSRLRQRNPLPPSGYPHIWETMHLSEEVDQQNVEDETGPAEIEGGNKRPRVDPQFDVNIGREMVDKMVVMHEFPLSFIEYFGFRDLMKYCKPLIGPLSNDLLKKEIFKLFIHVPFPYTAEMVCDELVELLIDWDLDRKLSALTIDSCSINDAMMSMLIAKFTVDSKVMGGRFFQLQCCAQILDLIMKDEMTVIEKDIERCIY
ncbi:hypothetical protein Patl1_24630 [Pistacia atlantica]|uniref:Uncharacterized protein n=1 Tax=Pistacia atlantica TaxID=434234 RepID=A0ACC0ZZW0_9ROSI|nr:hypothetical protein Patl1_24630 [Pistacia atlantica]